MKTQAYFIPIVLLFAGYTNVLQAQSSIVNSGAKITVGSTSRIISHNLTNTSATGSITNNGEIKLKGNFNQNTGAAYSGASTSLLTFEGTTLQDINGDATLNIARLMINNTNGVRLNQNINVNTELSLISGDLDLNGKNVDLGTTGVLSEDRANNHLVLDNTSINDANQGGGIIVSGVTITNASTEIRGTGLYLRRTAGSDYSISFTRKHYRGSGNGIKRIYGITGTPTGTNSTMRIYYANDERIGMNPAFFALFRWQSATGWKQATDAGSGFTNGTNGADYAEATGINSFSTWTIGSTESPLPLTLLSFSGKRQDKDNILLNWKTVNEVNTKGFEVEMSENGIDFDKIADVDRNLSFNYELTLKNPNAVYFRLKQMDLDGKFSYSNIVFVGGFEQEIKVFPNPVSEYLTLENVPQNTKIVINDLLGKTILETNSSKETFLQINVKDWQKGIYLIKIGKETKKIAIE